MFSALDPFFPYETSSTGITMAEKDYPDVIVPRPPYDWEIAQLEDTQHRPVPKTFKELKELRRSEEDCSREFLDDPELSVKHITIPTSGMDLNAFALEGNKHITIPRSGAVLNAITLERSKPIDESKRRPGIFFLHGGGRVMGTVFTGLNSLTEVVKTLDAIVISLEYPLSPDYPGGLVVSGCYEALRRISCLEDSFRIDSRQFMVAGVSAGAGLVAGALQMAHSRGVAPICCQLLMSPMLDDRCNTLSCQQFENGRGFYTAWNRYAWSCILGLKAGKDGVSPYVAPTRTTELPASHPPAYIDVGSGEPFRDEAIAYATKLWEFGVQAHLHVWGGGVHGFDLFYENALGREACATRNRWLIDFLRSCVPDA